MAINLQEHQESSFDVPGLHLHHASIINAACDHVEDRYQGGEAFTLVPSYTRPDPVRIIGEEHGITFHPGALAVEILEEVLSLERASANDAVKHEHALHREFTEAVIRSLRNKMHGVA